MEKLRPQVDIRRIDESSWQDYRDIRHQMLITDPAAFPPQAFADLKAPEEKWRTNITEGIILLAYDGMTPVGMVRATFDDGKRVAVARNMYTKPDALYRGQGIGKNLMSALLEELQRSGRADVVELEVEDTQIPAITMYEKNFKFVETGRVAEERTIDGQPHNGFMITMQRPIHQQSTTNSAVQK